MIRVWIVYINETRTLALFRYVMSWREHKQQRLVPLDMKTNRFGNSNAWAMKDADITNAIINTFNVGHEIYFDIVIYKCMHNRFMHAQ